MPHKRSDKAKLKKKIRMKLQKKKSKQALDALKQIEHKDERKKEASRFSSLKRQNDILKHALFKKQKDLALFKRKYQTSIKKNYLRSHSLAVIDEYPSYPANLQEDNYDILLNSKFSGVFGALNVVYLKPIDKIVVQKVISTDKSSPCHILAEVKICHLVSGHQYFPYCYGFEEPNKIFMELIGSFRNNVLSISTLKSLAGKKLLSENYLFSLSRQLIEAIMFLHGLNVLHNDIKMDNVVLHGEFYNNLKVIDFGKCSLISKPASYNLSLTQREKYNKFHRHLAYELRNLSNCEQTVLTDTYSVGYTLQSLGALEGCTSIQELGEKMKIRNPKDRLSLSSALKLVQSKLQSVF